jgi:Chlorophyllase
MTTSPAFRSASRLLLATAATAAAALAQVTDPAVITPYGAPCGVGLGATDTILPNGNHAVNFTATVAPNGPALLALGFQAVDLPLPDTGCRLLAEPLDIWFAPANGSGIANFALPLPAATLGTLFVQAATFDAALALQTSRGLELEFPGQSPTADPTTQTSYPCAYFQNLVWNYGGDGVGNVTGRVWWPSATCNSADGPPNGLPIVIFLHGNAMTHTDHDDILSHLARNGFVVCSVSNGAHLGGSNEGRAREAISYLNGMHAFWGYADRLTNDVAFAGHSRGGEAAITASRLLRDFPALMHAPYDVEAVLSIAPTDGGGDGSDPREVIDGNMTPAFLAIYGTHDADVRGQPVGVALVEPERTPFAIYDRAGTEASVEGILLPANNVTKSMIFVEGASHIGFLDGCNPLVVNSLSCDLHRDVARGYLNAFLRWQVLGQNAYRAYFSRTAVPTVLRVADVTTFSQFQGQPRRVVDNFEQGGAAVNTRGGAVIAGPGVTVMAEGAAHNLEFTCPHDTQVLRVRWNAPLASVRFEIPAANVPLVGPARDVTGYDYLSFRIGLDYTDVFNPPGEPKLVGIELIDGTPTLQTPLLRSVPAPVYFFANPFPYPAGDYTKSAMMTVRVPLSAFPASVDRTDIRAVQLRFDFGNPQGCALLDSLEFTN